MTGARRRSLPLPETPAANDQAMSGNPAAPPVESNARILESRKELDVTGPHTAVYRVKYSKRILTYSGKIREAEVKIPYNPACEEARLVQRGRDFPDRRASGNFQGRNQRDGRGLECVGEAIHGRPDTGREPAGRGRRIHHRG